MVERSSQSSLEFLPITPSFVHDGRVSLAEKHFYELAFTRQDGPRMIPAEVSCVSREDSVGPHASEMGTWCSFGITQRYQKDTKLCISIKLGFERAP
jgi:hypothetical protein